MDLEHASGLSDLILKPYAVLNFTVHLRRQTYNIVVMGLDL